MIGTLESLYKCTVGGFLHPNIYKKKLNYKKNMLLQSILSDFKEVFQAYIMPAKSVLFYILEHRYSEAKVYYSTGGSTHAPTMWPVAVSVFF